MHNFRTPFLKNIYERSSSEVLLKNCVKLARNKSVLESIFLTWYAIASGVFVWILRSFSGNIFIDQLWTTDSALNGDVR